MAVTRTNVNNGSSAAATSHSISFGFTGTSGRLLLFSYSSSNPTRTHSLPGDWTIINDSTSTGTRDLTAGTLYKISDGTETGVTVTSSGTAGLSWSISEWSGLATTSPIDQTAENESNLITGTTTPATGTTSTLSVSDGFAISIWGADVNTSVPDTPTYSNGSTTSIVEKSISAGLITAYKQLSSSTGFGETLTNGSNDQYYACVVVFKQAAASAVPSITAVTAENITSTTADYRVTLDFA